MFFFGNFEWIEEMFSSNYSKGYQEFFECRPDKAQLFMLSGQDQIYQQKLTDPFIAAMPESKILNEAFDLLIWYIVKGDIIYNADFQILKKNEDWGVQFIPNSFEETINLVIFRAQDMNKKANIC